jgi:hypothetical protein
MQRLRQSGRGHCLTVKNQDRKKNENEISYTRTIRKDIQFSKKIDTIDVYMEKSWLSSVLININISDETMNRYANIVAGSGFLFE